MTPTAGRSASAAPTAAAPTALVCLPFAGAGATFFRKWRRLTPPELTLVPVQLPGREEKFYEPPYTDVGKAMDEVCPAVLPLLDGVGRVALFGHSLGAELAYELAWRLTDSGTDVARLFVSGAPGPRDRNVDRVSQLDDAGFLEGLRRVAGYRHPAMDHPEMLQVMMPFLRADSEMHENYESAHVERLAVPITSLRGRDDELVSADEAGEWAGETSAGFRSRELDGGHMYLTEESSAVALLRTVADELADRPAGQLAGPIRRGGMIHDAR
ncbi:thioesterase [Streptacidiphilus sp. PB12-B1b]|uniref:thioesterase II family protein n=1 Tax=Streptacidiphilus sp. PB12-B1b TaxID=2705012 RepID=UPI0015F89FA6|nr:alpha/beta fold hydrolase [Streptacidiphilus sp. PB12-B1b]QMU77050.1 thioesterase [Streptacidiphilus sp. PB12-B1b]